MIPYKQLKVSSEDGTVSGSCMRTAIGSICEIDPETIPHWEDMETDWHKSFWEWLGENNIEYYGCRALYSYIKRANDDIEEGTKNFMQELKEYKGIDGYVYVYGKSPRAYVTRGHAVVFKDGVLVHDPHSSNEGITEIEGYYLLERK